MNLFADTLTKELHWIDSLFKFRVNFPNEDLRLATVESLHQKMKDSMRSPGKPEEFIASILLVTLENNSNAYSELASSLNYSERLFLALATIHKFLPGSLDKKIHNYFFTNLKEPASVIRAILGISKPYGDTDQFVPTINFLIYILSGTNIQSRISIYQDLHLEKIELLTKEIILLGDRDVEEPLFNNAFLLSESYAYKFITAN
jgi:hypothetical protein